MLACGAWRSLVAHGVWVAGVAGSNPAAPIGFKNREYPRIRAKSCESAGGWRGGIRGVSGMFAGIGTAEGPQWPMNRTARGPQLAETEMPVMIGG